MLSNFLEMVLSHFLFLISMIVLTTAAENEAMTPMAESDQRVNQFKPGITAIVVIFIILLLVIVMLLLYVKHCKRGNIIINNNNNLHSNAVTSRNSGVERKVIESLPMFRFSSLRGQKDGLECAVCLNKFEMDEVLRLLPKCKHAFHVECVDTWLDAHSTCPLCRYRVHPEDVLLVIDRRSTDGDRTTSTPRRSSELGKIANPRVSGRHSYAGGSLEIIAENPAQNSRVSLDSWNSRRKLRNSSESRKIENQGWRWSKSMRKDGELPVQQRRLEHRIVMSGEGEEEEEDEGRRMRRWSDVQAAEILYLKTEMVINGEEEEEGSGKSVIKGRSVSEITGMSRYRVNNGGKELEGKKWLGWISSPAVNSATSSS